MRAGARARLERAVELLAAGRTRAEIARELGIRPETVSRLLRRPEARELAAGLRLERVRRLSDRTAEAALLAVGVLLEVASDPAQPPAARVGAAGKLLEAAVRLSDLMDTVEAIEALERQLAELKAKNRLP